MIDAGTIAIIRSIERHNRRSRRRWRCPLTRDRRPMRRPGHYGITMREAASLCRVRLRVDHDAYLDQITRALFG